MNINNLPDQDLDMMAEAWAMNQLFDRGISFSQNEEILNLQIGGQQARHLIQILFERLDSRIIL